MKKPLTLGAVFIVILGSLFYCYEFFIQVAPGVMGHQLMQDLGANATMLGVMSGCFYYSYTALQIPAGLLVDRFGARTILTIVTLVCATGALIFSHSHTILGASVARLLMGAGASLAFVSALYLVIRWIPARHLALFMGLVQTMGSIGAIFGTTPLVIMISHIGWRHSMLIFFIVGILLALLILSFVRNHPKDYHEHTHQPISILQTLKIVLKNPQTWFFAIYSFAIWAPLTAFAALWGGPFLRRLQFSPLHVATAISLIWIGVALGSPLIGWISDRIGRRRIPLAIAALLGCITVSFMIYLPTFSLSTLYLMAFFLGLSASGQSLIFAVIKDNHHAKTSGAANGFNNMVVVSTGAILQPIIGKLLDLNWAGVMHNGARMYLAHDYRIALIILPILLFAAAIVSRFFIRETHCRCIK